MKIVICASASFEDQIIEWKNKLEKSGHEITKYPKRIRENLLDNYQKEFSDHYDAISRADMVLVLNFEKRGIQGYIGPGVFAEMSFAIGLNRVFNKKIEVLHSNPIPEKILPYSDELELWQRLGWIRPFDR